MTEVTALALVLAPFILALVQLIKKATPTEKNILPVTSLVLGLLVGAIAYPFTDLDLVMRLWAGGIAGLSATGFYEIGSHSLDKLKEGNK